MMEKGDPLVLHSLRVLKSYTTFPKQLHFISPELQYLCFSTVSGVRNTDVILLETGAFALETETVQGLGNWPNTRPAPHLFLNASCVPCCLCSVSSLCYLVEAACWRFLNFLDCGFAQVQLAMSPTVPQSTSKDTGQTKMLLLLYFHNTALCPNQMYRGKRCCQASNQHGGRYQLSSDTVHGDKPSDPRQKVQSHKRVPSSDASFKPQAVLVVLSVGYKSALGLTMCYSGLPNSGKHLHSLSELQNIPQRVQMWRCTGALSLWPSLGMGNGG